MKIIRYLGIINFIICCIISVHCKTNLVNAKGLNNYMMHPLSTQDTLFASSTSFDANTISYQGSCGDNLSWALSEENVLYIYGSGEMEDYNPLGAPWNQYRHQIKSVVIERGVTAIGTNAFFYCKNLESMELSESVSSIRNDAFSNTGLININLSKNILEIGEGAFKNCANVESIYYDVIALEKDRDAEYDYTKTIFTNVGKDTEGTSVVIGDDVTDIPDYLFCCNLDDDNIIELTIGKNVEYIGIRAFMTNGNLQRINYNARKVESFDPADSGSFYVSPTGPFVDCSTKGVELVIGDDVIYIPRRIFCTSGGTGNPKGDFICKKISIGKNLKDLNDGLSYFEDLEGFQVSGDNEYFTSIDGVLLNKAKTKIICYPIGRQNEIYEIPEGVLTVGQKAFYGCKNLTEVTICESVQEIESQAFYDNVNLTILIFSSNLNRVGENAFSGTNWIEEQKKSSENNIVLGGNVLIDGTAFEGAQYQTPDSVTVIADKAFYSNKKLKTITFTRITGIGENAFYGCGIETVMFSKDIKKIDNNAFEVCPYIKTVNYPGTEEEWNMVEMGTGNYFLTKHISFHSGSGEANKDNLSVLSEVDEKENKKSASKSNNTTIRSDSNVLSNAPAKVKRVKLINKKGKKVIVTWKKIKNSSYQIRYTIDKKMKKKLKYKKVKKPKATLKSLKKGKTYYIQVRALKTENGSTTLGKWSTKKKIKVKK